MKTGGWQRSVFSINLRQLLAYRAEFWVNFLLFAITEISVAYFLWKAVFTSTGNETMGGRTLAQMTFYYLLAPMTMRAQRGPSKFIISHEIYTGELNKYLLYPLSYFTYRYISHYVNTFFYFIQLLLIAGLFHLVWEIPPGVTFNLNSIAQGFILISIGSMLYFFIAACIEMLAFWADNTWSLMVLLRFILAFFGGSFIPLSLFPDWSQGILTKLPFHLLVSVPTLAMEGKLNWFEVTNYVGQLIFWIGGFYLLVKLMWNRGNLRYSGVGI